MQTATATSEARTTADRLAALMTDGEFPLLTIPAPSTIAHINYHVGYFADHSILIWARGEGFIVLDEERTYYRDDVNHLAKCLGNFTQEQRAEMIGESDRWIDGLHWAADGSFIGF